MTADPLAPGAADEEWMRDHGFDDTEIRAHLTPTPGDRYSYTDDGNAQRLVAKYGANIRYVPQAGKWLTWDTHRWRWDEENKLQEAARWTMRQWLAPDEDGEKHRRSSLNARRINAMLQLASSDPRVLAHAQQLDSKRLHLNTPAGVVDLLTGERVDPDRAQLHTRSTHVPPDPEMPTPRWDAFLKDTFCGDPDMTGYVQRLAGYAASGDVRHHVLPFLYGSGQNGKTVLAEVLRALLGDYAATAPPKFLMAQRYGGHETEIARLQGLRLVIASEVNQDHQFDEAKVKELTGADALTARFMRQDFFTFEPTHHLWLAGNYKPAVKSGGDSFWRRLRLVPFLHRVPDENRVDNLARILVDEEGPGILAWIAAGAVDLFAHGMREPAAVLEQTLAYAAEENHLGRFLEERCRIGGGQMVKLNTAILRAAYEQWCHGEGEQPLAPSPFGRDLKSLHGIDSTQSNGKRFYVGLSLLSLDEPESEELLSLPEDPDPWN
jgi:putative DNA primase/helicase